MSSVGSPSGAKYRVIGDIAKRFLSFSDLSANGWHNAWSTLTAEFRDREGLHDRTIEKTLFVLLQALRRVGIIEVRDEPIVGALVTEPQFGDDVEVRRGRPACRGILTSRRDGTLRQIVANVLSDRRQQ